MCDKDYTFQIAPLLKRGAENAIETAELKRMTGIKNDRGIRYAVKHDRCHGALILSNSGKRHGYYLPANREEAEKFVKSMRCRAISEFSNIKAVSEALKRSEYGEFYHQMNLEEIMREVNGA